MLYIQTSTDLAIKIGNSKYCIVLLRSKFYGYKYIKDPKIIKHLDTMDNPNNVSETTLKNWWR
jgi:hypothetical protein